MSARLRGDKDRPLPWRWVTRRADGEEEASGAPGLSWAAAGTCKGVSPGALPEEGHQGPLEGQRGHEAAHREEAAVGRVQRAVLAL